MKDLHIRDIPKNTMIVHWNDTIKRGSMKFVSTECPICHKRIYTRKINITSGHKKTSSCYAHRDVFTTRWAIKGEFSDNPNISVDYSEQKIMQGSTTRISNLVYILSQCPDCKEQRWIRLNCIRSSQKTTRCRECSNKIRGQYVSGSKNKGYKGGRHKYNGYMYVHREEVEKEYGKEFLELCDKYLKVHRSSFAEHRVVALAIYGSEFAEKGLLIRHLNGNKSDNRPINLAVGTGKENVNDHMTDRKLVMSLTSTVSVLLSMLRK